jgi:hypothetical protein
MALVILIVLVVLVLALDLTVAYYSGKMYEYMGDEFRTGFMIALMGRPMGPFNRFKQQGGDLKSLREFMKGEKAGPDLHGEAGGEERIIGPESAD